ncbi:hypothetical protein [Connecticut virus]|uniref:Uncharacterized protein n=1 Tax=Connecticut virus TaxID=1272962 RepID=A0A0D3R1H0_9RHAB|nr:hypothetical protein QKJ48_gp6 [Connecticut virus]AJR28564.1 hypothetical protein [Connecticut virus]
MPLVGNQSWASIGFPPLFPPGGPQQSQISHAPLSEWILSLPSSSSTRPMESILRRVVPGKNTLGGCVSGKLTKQRVIQTSGVIRRLSERSGQFQLTQTSADKQSHTTSSDHMRTPSILTLHVPGWQLRIPTEQGLYCYHTRRW